MNNSKKHTIQGIALVCVVSMLILGVLLLHLWEQNAPMSPPEAENTQAAENTPQPKDKLTTILVMGLDKFEAPVDAMGYLNDQQSDFLMLVVLDRETMQCDLLHLNRDTMTEIRRLGVGGGEAGKFQGQLALAHTYGSGGSDSCLNAVKAVSTFLKGQPIDHYAAMTMDFVGKLNDLVGGVTVTVMDDMTSVDPSFVKGQEVTLRGDQALRYVRTRKGLSDSSNLRRMERQRQYLEALYRQVVAFSENEDSKSHQKLMELFASLRTDLSATGLDSLRKEMVQYHVNPIRWIDGEAVKGEEFMEFYPDEASLQAVVDQLFYE